MGWKSGVLCLMRMNRGKISRRTTIVRRKVQTCMYGEQETRKGNEEVVLNPFPKQRDIFPAATYQD